MDNQAILDSLYKRGFAILSPFSRQETADIRKHLLAHPVYLDAHIPETARRRRGGLVDRDLIGTCECICVDTPAAILTPHVIERALALTDIAAAYLAVDPPVGYSMNAFWTRPGPQAERGDIQGFHRDEDDIRFLVMFIYLTDIVEAHDGPHDLIGPDGITRTIFGPAGTVFLADTSHMHRGRKPVAGERGLMWFRWGVSERPAANLWDKNEPIPAAALGPRYPTETRLQASIRLIAR